MNKKELEQENADLKDKVRWLEGDAETNRQILNNVVDDALLCANRAAGAQEEINRVQFERNGLLTDILGLQEELDDAQETQEVTQELLTYLFSILVVIKLHPEAPQSVRDQASVAIANFAVEDLDV